MFVDELKEILDSVEDDCASVVFVNKEGEKFHIKGRVYNERFLNQDDENGGHIQHVFIELL